MTSVTNICYPWPKEVFVFCQVLTFSPFFADSFPVFILSEGAKRKGESIAIRFVTPKQSWIKSAVSQSTFSLGRFFWLMENQLFLSTIRLVLRFAVTMQVLWISLTLVLIPTRSVVSGHLKVSKHAPKFSTDDLFDSSRSMTLHRWMWNVSIV